jgi:hypothetical protein
MNKLMIRPALALLALAAVVSARADDMVPLKLDLPKPLFVGTPRPIKVSNLEPPPPDTPAPFMVPAGTVLLSRGKKVLASDMEPVIGEVSCITDGDKSGIEGSYVELGPGVQWVQIDLEKPAKLFAIAVWHFHAEACVYHAVVIQLSNDPAFKTGVTTVYNNDDMNLDGFGKGSDLSYIETYKGRIMDAKGVTARYVRLYSDGSTSDELNHYIEVEVYGKPVN